MTGAILGGALSGLLTAELSRRVGLHLLPEEIVGIQLVGVLAGGWLKRVTHE